MLLLFFLFVHVHVRTRLLPAVLKFSFSKLRQSHTPNKPHNTKKNTKNKPSYIAVEFAGIFRGLGADVHLVFRAPSVLRGFDDECRAQVAENLGKRGVVMHPGTLPTKVVKRGDDDYVALGASRRRRRGQEALAPPARGRCRERDRQATAVVL